MNANSIDASPPGRGNDARATALPPALRGERVQFGELSYYVAGKGPPLLLIHSMNASPSAAEVRPLFERYAAARTVFALDLPGCGFSSRADRRYDPRLMTDALHLIAGPIRERCGDVAIDALAVSVGCEFLARAPRRHARDPGVVCAGQRPALGPVSLSRADAAGSDSLFLAAHLGQPED